MIKQFPWKTTAIKCLYITHTISMENFDYAPINTPNSDKYKGKIIEKK